MLNLVDEQRAAVELAVSSPSPVFITGSAGTGKSVVLRAVYEELSKTGPVALAASTGMAALNIGGITLHSMFGLPASGTLLGDAFRKSQAYTDFFQSLTALLIDEISMVRADILKTVDHALKYHLDSDEPFGGLKTVLFGDPFQLPPILRPEDFGKYDPFHKKYWAMFTTKHFFSAPVVLNCDLKVIELKTIHRQGTDLVFAEILDRIREGNASDSDLDYLINNSNQNAIDDSTPRLFGKNDLVFDYNLERLEELDPETEISFSAVWAPNPKCVGRSLRSSGSEPYTSVEPLVTLREKARVVFVKNDDSGAKRWVNGSMGEVVSLSSSKVTVRLDEGGLVEATPTRFEVRELVEEDSPKYGRRVYGDITGWMIQIPLKLSWAISVHKSQGQTFEKVALDFQDQYFEAGQAYVALSRAKSLSGVSLISSPALRDFIKPDKAVTGFMKLFRSEDTSELETALADAGFEVASTMQALAKYKSQNFKDLAALHAFLLLKLKSEGQERFAKAVRIISQETQDEGN